ncbi:MAG TPA: hypothetical protein VFE62_09570, partial [Gemmataceae bacterium]|nr:hypothetical protein [Gemmataceae bacterium]
MNPVDTNSAAKNGLSAGDSQFLQSLRLAQGENTSNEPPGLSSTPTMSGLLQALQRRWMLASGVAVAATLLAVTAVFFVMPPQFHNGMRFRVSKQAGSEDVTFVMFTANMEALVKSPLVLSAALNDKTADGRDIKDLELVRRHGIGAVDWLEKDLKTDYKLGPEILRVTLPSDMPEDAAQLLTAISKAFLNEYAQTEAAKKQQRLSELRGKKERIEEDLRGLRLALDRMYKSLEVKGREESNIQMQQWANKITAAEADKRANDLEISRTLSDIETYKARLKNLDKQVIPDSILFDVYGRDATIQSMEKKLLEIDLEIDLCKRKYPEKIAKTAIAPLQREKESILRSKSERESELKPKIEASWRKQLREDLTNQISVGEEKVVNFQRRRESLQNEIRDLEIKAKSASSGQRPPQIVALEEKIDLTKKSLEWTAQKISDVELEPAGSRITPLEPPGIPLDKDRSRQTKIAGAGGLAVFVFALFGVAFMEFRSRKIGVAAEVAQGLGLKVLGTIPAMPARTSKNDPAAAEKWQAQLNESVDAIRTVILHQARAEPLQVLMVTSAQKGEGKTTLATQLAASMARAW